ncbi:hypothetical protein DFH08DRAFT_631262, partial [Mycena albidolilacea]
CSRKTPRYRCQDCMVPDLFCQDCCVRAHLQHPLDRIERWDSTQFKRVTLKSMGLRVQLGHSSADRCAAPIAGHKTFTVIHTNEIHDVAVNFCGCREESFVGSCRQQLMRWSWYPATHKEPQTCSTLVCLEAFLMFHFKLK